MEHRSSSGGFTIKIKQDLHYDNPNVSQRRVPEVPTRPAPLRIMVPALVLDPEVRSWCFFQTWCLMVWTLLATLGTASPPTTNLASSVPWLLPQQKYICFLCNDENVCSNYCSVYGWQVLMKNKISTTASCSCLVSCSVFNKLKCLDSWLS